MGRACTPGPRVNAQDAPVLRSTADPESTARGSAETPGRCPNPVPQLPTLALITPLILITDLPFRTIIVLRHTSLQRHTSNDPTCSTVSTLPEHSPPYHHVLLWFTNHPVRLSQPHPSSSIGPTRQTSPSRRTRKGVRGRRSTREDSSCPEDFVLQRAGPTHEEVSPVPSFSF